MISYRSMPNRDSGLHIIRFSLVLLLIGATQLLCSPVFASESRTLKILREIDDMWRGESSYALISMKVKTRHYTRSLELEAWSKGKEKSLIRILSPMKEKGTATLKSGNTIYSYLPKTDRTIRLTSGMMSGSWMGSHFTNDDLVKESRLEDDYTPSISFEGRRGGSVVIEFTLIPKPDAPVVWGKLVTIVTANDYLPIVQKYYDEDMMLVREMRFSDVKIISGRRRPTVMRVIPQDKPKEYTELHYRKLEFNVNLSDAFFSLSRLKRY